MPAVEKSYRSFGHGLDSSHRERDERIGHEWEKGEKEEEGCSVAWEKIARNKSIQFPANRPSDLSADFLLARSLAAASDRRGTRRKSTKSRFMLFTAEHEMPNTVGQHETPRIASREDRMTRHCWTARRAAAFVFILTQLGISIIYIALSAAHNKISAIRFSRFCLCPPAS